MRLYYICVCLHLLTVTIWIGHMVFWTIFVGPVTKRIEPLEHKKLIRDLAHRKGGLGWPGLFVLIATGTYILYYKGIHFTYVVSGEIYTTPYGYVLSAKIILVVGMIIYQLFVGHRPAPKLIYADMLAAFSVIALSILLARVVAVESPYWDFKYPHPRLKDFHHESWSHPKKILGPVKLVVKSPAFHQIISSGTQLERLATGFRLVEGPVFNFQGEFLLFSDIPSNKIYKWQPGDGVSVFRTPSGHSNGLTIDHHGTLIAAEQGRRRVSKTLTDGKIVSLATHFNGKRLTGPNDVVVKSDGSIYFTDPAFGSGKKRELDIEGVYRIDSTKGNLSPVIDNLEQPNGLAFSKDEKTLYISVSLRSLLMAYDVEEDGTLVNSRIFAKVYGAKRGWADGVKVDSQDNVYMTGPGGVWVWDKHGKELGIVLTPEATTGMNWGDLDHRSLYITASTSLYRVRLNVSGPIYKND